MDCDKIKDSLVAYIHHELTEQDARLIEQHISQCKVCREEVNQLNKLSELLVKPPDNFADEVIERIKERKELEQFLNELVNTPAEAVAITRFDNIDYCSPKKSNILEIESVNNIQEVLDKIMEILCLHNAKVVSTKIRSYGAEIAISLPFKEIDALMKTLNVGKVKFYKLSSLQLSQKPKGKFTKLRIRIKKDNIRFKKDK